MSTDRSHGDPLEEFSLVEGGPLHRLYCRCGLMRLPVQLLGRRIVAVVLLVWIPPFLLSIAAGELYDGVSVPFLHHLAAHARLLGALPLLLLAEVLVHERIAAVVRQFYGQRIVPPDQRSRFEEIIRSSTRITHSTVPEVLLALTAFTLGHWLWIQRVALPTDTWYGRPTTGGIDLTTAGTWYAFISLPIFRFIAYRWYFRLAIWYRLLWKVSRLPLNLNPAHPDRAGGLGFLSQGVTAFAPILIAHTISASGLIGDQIWHRQLTLPHFKWELGVLVAILLLVVLIPLLFFAAGLSRARRKALRDHGIFAARYIDDFDRKWIRPSGAEGPSPLGNQDIQSLADLGTSYDVVRETRVVPIGKRSLINLAILVVLPLLPLALTMMPLEEVINRCARLLF
jgi:hypothetical protein